VNKPYSYCAETYNLLVSIFSIGCSGSSNDSLNSEKCNFLFTVQLQHSVYKLVKHEAYIMSAFWAGI